MEMSQGLRHSFSTQSFNETQNVEVLPAFPGLPVRRASMTVTYCQSSLSLKWYSDYRVAVFYAHSS